LVIPLVFCENRNVKIIEDAFLEELGFKQPNNYKALVRSLMNEKTSHQTTCENRYFKNIDGIKFLNH